MDRKEQLRAVIDNIIKGDGEAASAAFAPYVHAKTRDVLGYAHPTPNAEEVKEAFYKKLNEYIDLQDESPIQFQGDRVMVNGKQVGVIQSDPTDWDSGINFIEEGGRFSKEFDRLEDLYDFLIKKYTKGEAV